MSFTGKRAPQLLVDGELKFDAAVPEVAAQKRLTARCKAAPT